MFSLKRKGDFRLQLTRTLKQPGRHKIELYLFTPHESNLSAWTLSEEQFFFTTLTHSFGLLGMPSKDRISKADQSFVLLSPHYVRSRATNSATSARWTSISRGMPSNSCWKA